MVRKTALVDTGAEQLPVTATTLGPGFPVVIKPTGVTDGVLNCEFHCRNCGSWVLSVEDEKAPSSKVTCTGCCEWLCSWARLRLEALTVADKAGYPVKEELQKLNSDIR
jgi:hypothetical protein